MSQITRQISDQTSADAASYELTRLPLRNLRIDPRQPRQYLPADLRAQAASGKFTAPVILAELERRAAGGELESSQYLKDIDELAESLRADGLIYPLKVEALDPSDAYGVARILDGERRYWACVRRATQGEVPPFELAEVDVLVREAQLDERATRRLQWQANSQRRGMPVMALAEVVAQIHGELAAALQANRAEALARYGLAGEAKGRDRMLLVKMTALEVRVRTGRALSERMVYRLLMFVNRLTPETRALAKAADLDYRALECVAAVETSEQLATIWNLTNQQLAKTQEPIAVAYQNPHTHLELHIRRLRSLVRELQLSLGQLNQPYEASRDEWDRYLVVCRELQSMLQLHMAAVGEIEAPK